ncbi:MotA/TolQ/ExbB proton channel family protein [Bdellovibrionota bacterium FG-2]
MMSFEFVRNNFLHVLPILIAGCLAAAIMLERYKTLFGTYALKNPAQFLEQITNFTIQGKLTEAVALCSEAPSVPLVELVKGALLRAHEPEEFVLGKMEILLGEMSQRIQKRTSYLATLANVSTLLGLLGTIAGLITSFEAVAHADAQQKAALLANGISTAMNATLLGLAVAIPCMVGFSFLVNRSNYLIKQLETAALQMIDAIRRSETTAQSEEKAS